MHHRFMRRLKNPELAKQRQQQVLETMVKNEMLTEEEKKEILAQAEQRKEFAEKGLTIKYYKCNIKERKVERFLIFLRKNITSVKNSNRIGSKELVAVICSEKTEEKERGDRNGDRTRKKEKEADVCASVIVLFLTFRKKRYVTIRQQKQLALEQRPALTVREAVK